MIKQVQLTVASTIWAGAFTAAALSYNVSSRKPIGNDLLYAGEFMCPPAFDIERFSSMFYGIPLLLALLGPILIASYLIRRKAIYSAFASAFGGPLAVFVVFGGFDFSFPLQACEAAIRNQYMSFVPVFR